MGERTDFPCLDPHIHSQFTIPGSAHCPSLSQTRTLFLFSSLMASPTVAGNLAGFQGPGVGSVSEVTTTGTIV